MNDNKPRQPRGIPIGGQFATSAKTESGVSLATAPRPGTTPTLDRFFGDAERHDALLSRGYVPPTFFAALTDPRSTRRRREWWQQAFLAGEHQADGEGVRKASDSNNLSGTGGHGLDGTRRTHRAKYEDNGLVVRTVSMTGIKREFAQTGENVIDYPYSGVDESGKAIEGTVRVHRLGGGAWQVEALGVSGVAAMKISEAVASRLESRRPRRGPKTTGDLIERYKARKASQGATAAPVRSKWISAVGYNAESGVMFTETSNGNIYGHHVDAKTFEAVRGSSSPGAAFNSLVKGSQIAAVTRCEKCSRTYANANGHTCAVTTQAPLPGPKATNIAQRREAEAIATGASSLRTSGMAARVDTPVPAGGSPKAPAVPA